MKHLGLAAIFSFGSALTVGCGSAGDSSSDFASTASALEGAGQAMAVAATTYTAQADAALDFAACTAARDAYAEAVHAALAQMATAAQQADALATECGAPDSADLVCATDLIDATVREHLIAACGSDDMIENRRRAHTHADGMRGFIEHQHARAGQVRGGARHGAHGHAQPPPVDADGGAPPPPDADGGPRRHHHGRRCHMPPVLVVEDGGAVRVCRRAADGTAHLE